MKTAFYITVDDGYLGIGLAQAKRLHALWGIDVHLFIEGAGGIERDETGNGGIFVHRNLMHDQIPSGLPSTESWPRIVYGRIFAPFLLGDYDRLIYLDADIFPMTAAPEILELDMPGGFAAVQDGATINGAPHSAGDDRAAWKRSIGLNADRYFNAGVMILDQKMWAQVDFAHELLDYMARHGTNARMQDQDFLNCYFQDRWTELSPRFNYQKSHFNYGYERVFPPVFLHFSSFEKPWLQPASLDTVHGQFFAPYQDMFARAGVDYRDYLRQRPESILRKLRTRLRDMRTRSGVETSKERRQRDEWRRKSDAIFAGLCADAQQNRYADMDFTLSEKPEPRLSFDGRYLRRALDISYTPIE